MQLSLWDSLNIETALSGGTHRLLTEDLQHGQTIDGLLIENPFFVMGYII
jgi:predicted nucleic acid-binding protein